MSNELSFGCGTGKSIYCLLKSGAKFLNKNTVALDSVPLTTYSNYVVAATELGTTGVYVASIPVGTPANDFDVFPYESVGGDGNEAQGDPFAAGSFSIRWSGSAITDALGSGVDSATGLITLADAKQYLKVTSTSDDAIIAVLINQVSAWIQGYLKRNLVATDYVEYYSGDGTRDLCLRNFPIVSLSSLYIDSLRAWSSDTLVDTANLIVKKSSGILTAFNLLYGFTPGQANIKVSYTAGYTIGVNGGAGTLPYDIRFAAKRILDHHYRLGYSQRKLDYQTESMQQVNTTFRDFDIPKDVKLMLDGYRNTLPVSQFEYAD